MKEAAVAGFLIVALLVGAGAGYLAGTSTERTTTSTQILTSSIPSLVKINGVVSAEDFKPIVVKFVPDICTNTPFHTYCELCRQITTQTTSTSVSSASSGAIVSPNCVTSPYSANVTIVGSFQRTVDNQTVFVGNFSVSVPNGYGYTLIPWLSTPSHPEGQGVEGAGYFLVDTPIASINEPAIECYFPNYFLNSNYNIAYEMCFTVSSYGFPLFWGG